MSTPCTRCEGTGFLNTRQIVGPVDLEDPDAIARWVEDNENHDVTVCDCCGDGEEWYGTPGEHYNAEDPSGPFGPYGSNGGLCECH